MKPKTTQKMALFIIFLIMTMPFYSASAIAQAQIQVTKNTGNAGVPGFLDAAGDTWEVVVDIAGINATPTPEQLALKVGSKSQQFDQCSDSAIGFTCTYTSPLPITLTEKSYDFNIQYIGDPYDPNSQETSADAPGTIRADGSAPTVTNLKLKQEKNAEGDGTHILMDFTVSEQPGNNAGAGIKTIEVLDADTNQVLQTITPLPKENEKSVQTYNYGDDTTHSHNLEVELSGEGQKRIKVRATDALGHITAVPPIASVKTDFISPVIDTASARLVDSQNFIGIKERYGTFEVNVTDTNLISNKVIASADGTDLENKEGSCVNTVDSTYTCTWSNILLTPQAAYTIIFHAQDELGNTATASATITLVQDTTPPEIIFFGTNHVFEDQSYVTFSQSHGTPSHDTNQKVILIASEQGSGITPDTVAANLDQLGGLGSMVKPDTCYIPEGEANYRCEWNLKITNPPSGNTVITLPKFQDAVENVGASREASIRVDTGGPVVDKISFFGVSDAGEKDYFQSNDRIKIKFNVTEQSGLDMYIDMHDLIGISEADQQFPENNLTATDIHNGSMHFDQTNCERKVEKNENGEDIPTFVWECAIETVGLKSGPAHPSFTFFVRDTAGNDAQKWNYEGDSSKIKNMEGRGNRFNFELLGLAADEENPDFWQVQSAGTSGFIDLETTALLPARIPIDVQLSSKIARAEAISIKVQGCAIDTSGVAPTTGPSVVNTASQKAADEAATTEATTVTEEAPGPAANLQITRTILYGADPDLQKGVTNPQYTVLLEFAPFDGKEQFVEQFKNQKSTDNSIDIPIVCNVQIFSKIGANAIRNPEMEEVKFTVPFSFSSLGAMDENLKHKIDDLKDHIGFKIADKLEVITKIITWVQYLGNIVTILTTISQAYNLITGSQDSLKLLPPSYAIAVAGCHSNAGAQGTIGKIVDVINVPLQLLSCNPQPYLNSGVGALTAYGKYQMGVLEVYNTFTLRKAMGVPATSLYENLYISMMGVCLPGILYNLEKYRQVKCQSILCYKNDVPSGLATPSACAALDDYLTCKYFLGPAIGAFGPTYLIDQIGQFIKNVLTSPLGIIREVTLLIACQSSCEAPAGNAASAACINVGFIVHLFDLINSIIDTYNRWPTKVANNYCDQI